MRQHRIGGAVAQRRDINRLFTPGAGALPPVFAGRKAELKVLDSFRLSLLDEQTIHADVLLHGPRGNGKTALLRRFERLCAQNGIPHARFVLESAAEFPDVSRAAAVLSGTPVVAGAAMRSLDSAKSIAAAAARALLSPFKRGTIKDALRARLRKGRPLVLAIDEAHRLPPDVGGELLNASQILRGDGYPLLLILAGTPDIRSALAKMEASFWARSEKLPIGRLEPEEIEEALAEPLDKLGFHFSPAALGIAQEHIVGYPYFAQLWGEALTRTKEDFAARPEISAADAAKASCLFVEQRDGYYQERRAELRKAGLLPAARAVAEAFGEGRIEIDDDVVEAVRRACGKVSEGPAPEDAARMLAHLGFVWAANGRMEPGIPSLMDHVLRRGGMERARAAEAEPTGRRRRA